MPPCSRIVAADDDHPRAGPMRFWDSSALVPLLLREPMTAAMAELLEADPEIAAWWATPVECASAAARLRREGTLDIGEEGRVLDTIDLLRASYHEILAGADLQRSAMRLLRVHALRAADALQLAAAVTWAGSSPFEGAQLVTLDERLAEAATLEGFQVLPRTHPA